LVERSTMECSSSCQQRLKHGRVNSGSTLLRHGHGACAEWLSVSCGARYYTACRTLHGVPQTEGNGPSSNGVPQFEWWLCTVQSPALYMHTDEWLGSEGWRYTENACHCFVASHGTHT
jgi:hypothetical protein